MRPSYLSIERETSFVPWKSVLVLHPLEIETLEIGDFSQSIFQEICLLPMSFFTVDFLKKSAYVP